MRNKHPGRTGQRQIMDVPIAYLCLGCCAFCVSKGNKGSKEQKSGIPVGNWWDRTERVGQLTLKPSPFRVWGNTGLQISWDWQPWLFPLSPGRSPTGRSKSWVGRGFPALWVTLTLRCPVWPYRLECAWPEAMCLALTSPVSNELWSELSSRELLEGVSASSILLLMGSEDVQKVEFPKASWPVLSLPSR